MPQLPAPPLQDSVVELEPEKPSRRDPFFMAKPWIVWIQNALVPRLQQAAQLLTALALGTTVPLSGSIGATPLPLGVLAGGRYRVSTYARIVTPDGVSSSLTVSIRWTEGGVALVVSGAAMVGDSITTVQSETYLLTIDAVSAISYSTVYASNTPNQMKYRLSILVEAVG